MKTLRFATLLMAGIVFALWGPGGCPSVRATTYSWTNTTAGTQSWTTSADWSPAPSNVYPRSGDNAFLTNNIAGNQLINLNGAFTIDEVILGSGNGVGTFTLANGSSGPLSFASPGYLVDTNNGGDTVSANMTMSATALTVYNYGTKPFTISGNIAGGQNANFNGPGTIVLSGANTFGTPYINGGTLIVTSTSGLGTGITQLNGGALDLWNDGVGNNGTIVYGKSMFIAANVASTINVDHNSANTGNTIQLNNFTFGGSGAETLTVTGGDGYSLQFTGLTTLTGGTQTFVPSSANLILNNVTNSSTLVLAGTTTGNQVTGAMIGTGSIVKTNTSTWTFSGVNTYTGTTTVKGGALGLDSAKALPGGIGASGGTSHLILNGGVVELGAGDFTRWVGTTSGTNVEWQGSGGFSAVGANRIVNLGGSFAQVTWASGSFVPNGSSLIFGYSNANAQVDFQNSIALGGAVRTIQVDDNPDSITDQALISGAISGSAGNGLTKTGTGKLLLSAINTYTGLTTINAGTLVVNGGLMSTTVVINAGASLGGSGTLAGVIKGAGSVNPGNSPGILTVNQVDPTGGLSFNFEISNLGTPTAPASPDYANVLASGNDVLRITNATPFTGDLTLNTVNLYLASAPNATNAFYGGFFTDANSLFTDVITNATYNVYLETAGGAVSYNGNQYNLVNPIYFSVSTVETNAFGTGGFVSEFQVAIIPEPVTLFLLLVGGLTLWFGGRRQRS